MKEINEVDKEANIENKKIYSQIKINEVKEENNKNIKNEDKKGVGKNEENKLKENNNKKQKLNKKEMKDLITKINYTPPNWAINMSDEDFIKTVQKYINNK